MMFRGSLELASPISCDLARHLHMVVRSGELIEHVDWQFGLI